MKNVRSLSRFIYLFILHVDVWLLQHYLLKTLSFLHCTAPHKFSLSNLSFCLVFEVCPLSDSLYKVHFWILNSALLMCLPITCIYLLFLFNKKC